jgi:starvation-inducible DNA-binding protein
MHPTKNNLPANVRTEVVKLLNARLADALDLYLQAKQAHWNVKGPNFIAYHELFDEVATRLLGHSDELAERATELGGIAEGTSQVVGQRTTLKPYPITISAGREHVDTLSSALADFGAKVRAAIDTADGHGDKDTADLFTEISRAVDKDVWFLEAHLQSDR